MSAAGKTEGAKGSDNVQVAVRCRPLSSDEQKAGHSVVVRVDSERGEVMLSPPSTKSEKQRTFVFDSVFDFDSQQLDVYNETARPIVDSVLEGYNGIHVRVVPAASNVYVALSMSAVLISSPTLGFGSKLLAQGSCVF